MERKCITRGCWNESYISGKCLSCHAKLHQQNPLRKVQLRSKQKTFEEQIELENRLPVMDYQEDPVEQCKDSMFGDPTRRCRWSVYQDGLCIKHWARRELKRIAKKRKELKGTFWVK